MISLNEIQAFYPPRLHGFKRFMLREYLQYKILEIIFDSTYHNKLCFMGGTCLRIVHGNTRFSEDLDFDNVTMGIQEFESLSGHIRLELTKQGYDTETKTIAAGAFHCHVKFPGILFSEGLSAYKEEKILIQIDTEPQAFNYEPDSFILNKFDVFTSIKTTPPDLLTAQKLFALLNRKRKKGRDFFDLVFLLKKNRPNYAYLNQKLNIPNASALKERVLEELEKIDLREMSNDVSPFLFEPNDKKTVILFKDIFLQLFKD
jgi:predicted nucleotidyltransferase